MGDMDGDAILSQLTAAIEGALAHPERWPDVYGLLQAVGAPPPNPASAIAARFVVRYGLTQTEHDVLRRIFEGRSPREIAALHGVSLATVRTHIAHLHEKSGVGRTIDLLRLAILDGPLRH